MAGKKIHFNEGDSKTWKIFVEAAIENAFQKMLTISLYYTVNIPTNMF